MHSRTEPRAVNKLASCTIRLKIGPLRRVSNAIDERGDRLYVVCSRLFQCVSHTKLSTATLRAVVQEFVTRDGTDYSCVERRVENVLRQLEVGRVELHYDDHTQTCNIVTVQNGGNPQRTM